jgi:hypothetical protein
VLEPNLEAGDILFDLFDKGQMLRQLRQAIVRLDTRLIDRRRAGGDESRIELVVLGPTLMHARIGFDLDRLQDQNNEALAPQIADHAALVAAARLDADSRHPGLEEFSSKTPPANRCVGNLPLFRAAMNRNVELGLRCIYSPPFC